MSAVLTRRWFLAALLGTAIGGVGAGSVVGLPAVAKPRVKPGTYSNTYSNTY
jgi:hypothetical protein